MGEFYFQKITTAPDLCGFLLNISYDGNKKL